MAVAAPAPAKIRWGELEEDEADDLGYLLPPPQVIGPDESGTKRIIEYKFNKDGEKVKVTTVTRIRKIARARLNKRAIERRSWAKFGGAALEDSSLNISVVSTEEICIERPRAPGSKTDEPKAGDPLLAAKGGAGAVLMVCRLCGKKGDHWTSKCPNKDLLAGTEGLMDSRPPPSDAAAPTAADKSTYVPPSLRGDANRSEADMIRRRNDENSVRVTNLSEDTHEPDLLELFRPFGHVTRVYVAVDQKTGISRGFGFVNFLNREDAERAINKLNGYGYDNLILRVEWATPRAN